MQSGCIVCYRQMSQPSVCYKCVDSSDLDHDPRPVNATTELIIELAECSMRSDDANLLVRTIPKYFAEFPEWVVDYQHLANVASRLLLVIQLKLPLKKDETIMLNWLTRQNALQLSLTTNLGLSGRLRLDITNTDEKENDFRSRMTGKYEYLYHGSIEQNWYGIIKHGLKNMSLTTLSQNGSAFGNGIYCTTDWTLAASYCKNSKRRIVAVVQSAIDPHLLKFGRDTYVIPDAQLIIVRYLILVDCLMAKI